MWITFTFAQINCFSEYIFISPIYALRVLLCFWHMLLPALGRCSTLFLPLNSVQWFALVHVFAIRAKIKHLKHPFSAAAPRTQSLAYPYSSCCEQLEPHFLRHRDDGNSRPIQGCWQHFSTASWSLIWLNYFSTSLYSKRFPPTSPYASFLSSGVYSVVKEFNRGCIFGLIELQQKVFLLRPSNPVNSIP